MEILRRKLHINAIEVILKDIILLKRKKTKGNKLIYLQKDMLSKIQAMAFSSLRKLPRNQN